MEFDIVPNLRDLFTVGWTMIFSGGLLAWIGEREGHGESAGGFLFLIGIAILVPQYFMWLGSYLQFGS